MDIEKIVNAFCSPKVGDEVYIVNFASAEINPTETYEVIDVQDNNDDVMITVNVNNGTHMNFTSYNFKVVVNSETLKNLIKDANEFVYFIENQDAKDFSNLKNLNKKYKAYNIFKAIKSTNNDMEIIDKISEII